MCLQDLLENFGHSSRENADGPIIFFKGRITFLKIGEMVACFRASGNFAELIAQFMQEASVKLQTSGEFQHFCVDITRVALLLSSDITILWTV